MYSQKQQLNHSQNRSLDEQKKCQKMRQSTEDTTKKPEPSSQTSPYMRIITSLNDPSLFKLKRGKNTPAIHIFTLRKYMHEFQHLFILRDKDGKEVKNYYEEARRILLEITDQPVDPNKKNLEQKNPINPSKKTTERQPKRKNVNTKHLVQLFGGPIPNKNDKQAINNYIIRRMNARVLELIYQKYMVEIMFGSSKMEDKLTNSLFIHEYRTRLSNPLLCGGLECIRPMEKQKKYPKKAKKENPDKEKTGNRKRKPIEKKK